MPSVEIDLRDGDSSYTIRVVSEQLKSFQGDVLRGASASAVFEDAAAKIRRAAGLPNPDDIQMPMRFTVDGSPSPLSIHEIEYSADGETTMHLVTPAPPEFR